MKKFIFVLLSLLVAAATAGAQTTKVSDKTTVEGKNYTSVSTRSGATAAAPISTGYTWTSPKGETYPLYLHKYQKGENQGKYTVYVLRTSTKTGKEYKYYLPDGVAIAEDILKRNPNLIK